MVCLAIIIHKNGHVTRHLAAWNIPTKKLAGFSFSAGTVHSIAISCTRGIIWHITRIGPVAPDKLIRPCYVVADSHSGACRVIALSPKFQVKPHYIFPGFFIKNHFRPLQYAALRYLAGTIVRYFKRDALILPVTQ